MVDANFVLNLVEAVGILVGVAIAIMEIRRSREERDIHFSIDYVRDATSPEGWKSWFSFLRNMDFSSYEEWSEKYGPYVNPEAALHWYSMFSYYDGLGRRILNGHIDLETVLSYLDPIIPFAVWEKSKTIFEEWRERFNYPDMEYGFEFLVKELKRKYPDVTYIPNPERQRFMQQP